MHFRSLSYLFHPVDLTSVNTSLQTDNLPTFTNFFVVSKSLNAVYMPLTAAHDMFGFQERYSINLLVSILYVKHWLTPKLFLHVV